jgi:hypothetical protein
MVFIHMYITHTHTHTHTHITMLYIYIRVDVLDGLLHIIDNLARRDFVAVQKSVKRDLVHRQKIPGI